MGVVIETQRGRLDPIIETPQQIFGEDLHAFYWGDDPGAFTLNVDGEQINVAHNLSTAAIKAPNLGGGKHTGAPTPKFPLIDAEDGNIAWFNEGANTRGFFFASSWSSGLVASEIWFVQKRVGPLTTDLHAGHNSHSGAGNDQRYPAHTSSNIIDNYGSSALRTFDGSAVPFETRHVYQVLTANPWTAWYNGNNLLHSAANVVTFPSPNVIFFGTGATLFERTYTGWRWAIVATKRAATNDERNRMNRWLRNTFIGLNLVNF